MKGLRVSRVPEGIGFQLSGLEGRLGSELSPHSEAAWLDAVQPFWLSEFSRYFGPLLPELSQRKWLICDPDWPLLNRPFVDFYDLDKPVKALKDLEALEFLSKDRWRVVAGDYLLRIVNHLCEDDLRFFGIPDSRWDAFWNQRHQFGDNPQMEKLASQHSDMIFCSYEGIWAAFFEDVKLLARTFFHCAENYLVFEIEEGIGFDGNWLTGCHRTCPNLPLLLDRQNRPERYAP